MASAGMTWRGGGVNYGHPPARCARVPLRGAKGGGGTRCCGRGVAVKGVLVVWVEMACFVFRWVPASAGMT